MIEGSSPVHSGSVRPHGCHKANTSLGRQKKGRGVHTGGATLAGLCPHRAMLAGLWCPHRATLAGLWKSRGAKQEALVPSEETEPERRIHTAIHCWPGSSDCTFLDASGGTAQASFCSLNRLHCHAGLALTTRGSLGGLPPRRGALPGLRTSQGSSENITAEPQTTLLPYRRLQ